MPGQILVGDFALETISQEPLTDAVCDAIGFIEQAQNSLSQLNGLELSGDAVESIKCYLTGAKGTDGEFGIKKYRVVDKHGGARLVYNAKVNIHRHGEEPIFLGIQDQDLESFAPVVGA